MIDNFDHDKFTKLVEKKLTQEGVFDSIGKYFSDIWKAGQNAAADPERYWKEKQQRHWTHGDGTKRTEQPPEPPKEAEDELPPATFVDVENMKKFVALMNDALVLNKKITEKIPSFEAWDSFFQALGNAVEEKLGVAQARHDPNELGDASYFQAPEGEEQQEINESLDDPLLTEVIADNKFRAAIAKLIKGEKASGLSLGKDPIRDQFTLYFALRRQFPNRSQEEYANAIFSVADLSTTTLAILSAVDPKSFESELPSYYLYGNKDTSLIERRARKVFIDLAGRDIRTRGRNNLTGQVYVSGGYQEHVIFQALEIIINTTIGNRKDESAFGAYLMKSEVARGNRQKLRNLVNQYNQQIAGEAEKEAGEEAEGEKETDASEEEVEAARDGLRGLLGLDDDGNPNTPKEPIDQEEIEKAKEFQNKGKETLELIMQMGAIMKDVLEVSAELSKTQDFKSLNGQFPPYIKFMIAREDKLNAEMKKWQSILDTLEDAPEEKPEEPEDEKPEETKPGKPKTNPFAGPMNENIKFLKEIGLTDKQIEDLILKELDTLMVDTAE